MEKNGTENKEAGYICGVLAIGLITYIISDSFLLAIFVAAGIAAFILHQANKQLSEDAEEIDHNAQTLDLINDATDYSRALTLHETEFFCSIAGVLHYNDEDNIGSFIGYCMADPKNRHDKNAIGIYESGGRLVGYIPKDEQKNFRAWSKRDPLPCIGFIEEFDDRIRGKVKVIDACPELTELHMFKFIRWLILNHGKGFIPSNIKVHKNVVLITKNQWLDFIEECIVESNEAVKALRKASTNRQEQ